MSKWYVEYKAYGKMGYMGGIEAIEILKSRVVGVNRICGVWHDDEDEEEEE